MVGQLLDRFEVVVPVHNTRNNLTTPIKFTKVGEESDTLNLEILDVNGVVYVRETSSEGSVFLPLDEYRKDIIQTSYSPGKEITEPVAKLYYGKKLKDLDGICVDFGCGKGDFLVDVVSRLAPNLSLVGIDINEEHIKKAREVTKGNSRYQFIHQDMTNTGLNDNSVDFAAANSSLSYVGWPRLAIREISRILKPEGDLLILDSYNSTEDYRRWLREEGFDDIKERARYKNEHFVMTAVKK